MAGDMPLKFDFQADNTGDLKAIEEFKDVNYPTGLIDNLHEVGFQKPSKIQQCILQCMENGLTAVGNVPSNVDAEVAYISYTVAECIKAKQENKYKPDEYKPYAVFIAKDNDMMDKLYDLATDLARDLGVTTVSLTREQFANETSCEFAMQECDLVFLTADGFNNYVKDELVIFENLKIIVVHDLCIKEDKKRLVQFEDMFNYHDFPKFGDRILIFFDDDYSEAARSILKNDKKAFILFDKNAAATEPAEDYVDPDNFEIEEDFKICVSKDEKDEELVKHLETFRDEYFKPTCPVSVIWVKDYISGQHVQQVVRRHNMEALLADGNRKRTDTQATLERFSVPGGIPILIAANLNRLEIVPKFYGVTTMFHYDAPDHWAHYTIRSQVNYPEYKPRKVVSLLGGYDWYTYKDILDIYTKKGKDVGKLQTIVATLKQLYAALPSRPDDFSTHGVFRGYSDDEDDDY